MTFEDGREFQKLENKIKKLCSSIGRLDNENELKIDGQKPLKEAFKKYKELALKYGLTYWEIEEKYQRSLI